MLVNPNKYLKDARKRRYAIPHFNTSDLEITQAIVEASVELKSPVIIATSQSSIKYAGIKKITEIVKIYSKQVDIPIVLHLDHGEDLSIAKRCINAGYTSVMIDGSHFPIEKNIKITKKVVDLAHKKRVSVEAELGRLAGIEDKISVKKKDSFFRDPLEAKKFVKETKVDSLAVSIP